jgi:phosphoserine phosphatase
VATVVRGRRSDHLQLKQALVAMLRRPPRLTGHQLVVHFAPHAPMPRDFYEFSQLPDGRLLVVLGHVEGSGPGASLLAGATLSTLRTVAPRHRELPALIAALNDAVRADLVHGCTIGIGAAILDPASNRLVCLAAGHPPMAVLSARRDEVLRQLRSTGASLGALVGADFRASLEPIEVRLAPGDIALFPGHGLAHAADPADPDAGRWAILATAVEAIKRPCAELVEQVMARAKAGREQHRDDLLAVAVRVKDESWLLEAKG